MAKTPNWNETETITTTDRNGRQTTTTRLTSRAWDERCAYAVKFIEQWSEAKSVVRGKGVSRKETQRLNAERYAGIVMLRLADGFEAPLVSPAEFAKKHKVERIGIAVLVNTPKRYSSQGWTVKGREITK